MFYTYYVKAEGKYYFGSRTPEFMLNRDAKDDFMIKYFTSTTDERLREIIRNKEYEKAEIIKEYTDRKECLKDEARLIEIFWEFYGRLNCWNHFANDKFSTAGKHHSEKARKNMSNAAKQREQNKTDEDKLIINTKKSLTMRNKSTVEKLKIKEKAKQTIANKTIEQREIEHCNRSKAAQGENNGMYGKKSKDSPVYNRKWMNNGIEQIYIDESMVEYYLSLGYVLGMMEKTPENKEILSKKLKDIHNNRTLEDKEKISINLSNALKGKHKQKYYWQTPEGEIVKMGKSPVIRFHPYWVEIGPVED